MRQELLTSFIALTALIAILIGASASYGSTITTIQGTDTLTSSRSVINTNFSNLNTDKVETTNVNSYTALQKFYGQASSTLFSCLGPCYFGTSATSSFGTDGSLTVKGTFTIGNTALSLPVSVANGGTNNATFPLNVLTFYNGTSILATSSLPLYVGSIVGTSTALSNSFAGKLGLSTTSPFARLTLDNNNGTASSSILVQEYRPGTTTTATIDCRSSNTTHWRIGSAATTLTLSGLQPGQNCTVIVENPNGTAGPLTWVAGSGYMLLWAGGAIPTQNTNANKQDVWNFKATQGSSTMDILGAQTSNF